MNALIITCIVVGVIVIALGGLFLYGACKHSSQEYAPED